MYAPIIFALISCVLAAPLIKVDGDDAIPGKWIVKLKGEITSQAEDEIESFHGHQARLDVRDVGLQRFCW
jgi:hypothetical protein